MVLEKEYTISNAQEREKAREHNEQISENYKNLQNAIESQFSVTYASPSPSYSAKTDFAPVQTEGNRVQQRPQVREYASQTMAETMVFTTEKFGQTEGTAYINPEEYATQEKALLKEESYSLTPLAKMIVAGFVAVVTLMLTMAAVNTRIINENNIKLRNLEQQKQELILKNEEIQRNIEKNTSEETIRKYAEEKGMIKVGE